MSICVWFLYLYGFFARSNATDISSTGKMDQTHEMFPASNRGKQTVPNCFAALAFAYLFIAGIFKPTTVDAILKYGDRLYTFAKRQRASELKANKDLGLTAEEIDVVVDNERYGLADFNRKFCIGDMQVRVERILNFFRN